MAMAATPSRPGDHETEFTRPGVTEDEIEEIKKVFTRKDTQNGKPDSLDNALRRVDAAFEFFKKLGVDYYAFHDIDAAPEGAGRSGRSESTTQCTSGANPCPRRDHYQRIPQVDPKGRDKVACALGRRLFHR